jgi:hypothetical protein
MIAEGMDDADYQYDVAVSFAGEDRNLVEQVVQRLHDAGVKVFYDQDQSASLWGENLVDFLHTIYSSHARYAVIFVSHHYAEKKWPRHERRSAQESAFYQESPYILPVRLDDTDLPGLPSTIGYIDARVVGVDGISNAVVAKLSGAARATAPPRFNGKVPRTPGETATLLAERPEGWEYFLYAGTLRQGIDSLEPKYRDHLLEYAPHGLTYLEDEEAVRYLQRCTLQLQGIINLFNKVLSRPAQLAAFGPSGEAGDPDRIVHLGSRLVSVYEEFIDCAADIRSAAVRNKHLRRALEVTARFSDSPVESIRSFVEKCTEEVELLPKKFKLDEPIVIALTVTLDIDDELAREHSRALEKYGRSLE